MFFYILYIKWRSQRQVEEAELKEAQSQVKEAKSKVEQLQTQLQKAQSQVEEAELKEAQSVKEAKSKVEQLQTQLQKAQSQVEEAELKVEQLQTQLKEKANIISISLRTTSQSIDLNNISLFITNNKLVFGYDTEYVEVFNTRHDSLKKIEEKIKNSGWSEDRFLRIADHLLIKPSSIRAWVQDSGKNVIYFKRYRKYDTKEILGQKLILGIEVPNSKKYKKNQQKMRNHFQPKKI